MASFFLLFLGERLVEESNWFESHVQLNIKDFLELWMSKQGVGGWKWRVWRMIRHMLYGDSGG